MKIVIKLIKNCFVLFTLSCALDVAAQEMVSGSVIGRHIFGLATDYQGDPVLIEDKPLIFEKSQFDTTITIDKAKFLVSGFKNQIGGVYITQIDPNNNKALDTVVLNLAKVDGLSSLANGIKTRWNSILMAESGLIDAANPKDFINAFKPYYKGKSKLVQPYKYGWVSEVIVLDSSGQAKAIKNYALGRVFASQVIIMPDNKTIYMLDDLGNLYLFVAAQEKSFAKGQLYAVDRQNDKLNFTLLGKPAALKVKFKLKKAKFKSIFKSVKPKNQTCSRSYTYIKTIYGEECLKVNRKYKKYAALFEPIRIRAMKGISAFSSKNSQMTFNVDSNELRFSHSGQDDINLSVGKNPKINSQFVIKEL